MSTIAHRISMLEDEVQQLKQQIEIIRAELAIPNPNKESKNADQNEEEPQPVREDYAVRVDSINNESGFEEIWYLRVVPDYHLRGWRRYWTTSDQYALHFYSKREALAFMKSTEFKEARRQLKLAKGGKFNLPYVFNLYEDR